MMMLQSVRIMRAIRAVGIIAVAVCTARASLASEFAPFDPIELNRQIARLSHDDWRVRRDAVRALVKVGPPVEAPLRDLLAANPSPELRLRAQEILRRVQPMCRTQATLITLDLSDVSAKAAFDQLARIEGAPLRVEPIDLLDHISRHITARVDHRPYWEVVLELCRQADLRLRCNESGVTVVHPRKASPPRKFSVSGMFLLTPTWLSGFKEVGSGMRISVFAEPRGRVLTGDSPFTLLEASDAAGKPCLSGSSLSAGGASATNGYSWSAPLSPSAHPGTLLVRCRGIARLIIAETFQTLEAPGFDSENSLAGPMPIRLTAGSMSASIVRVVNAGSEYQMDIQLATDPAEVDWNSLIFSAK
jgi:hypothetical protein